MKNFRNLLLLSGFLVPLMLPSGALAAVAGHIQFVHGEVQITTPAGQVRAVRKGDAVNEGDVLTSAKEASAQIRMQDGGFIAVRPETRMKFDQFRFSGKAEDGNDRSFFSLIKGGFRSITGLIGRVNKQNYRVTTPAATIGIRGTDYEAVYTEAAPANLAAADMLMAVTDVPAPIMGGGFAAAIVNKGAIEMSTNKGTTLLQPGQGMVVSYGMNQLPVIKPLDINLFPGAGKDKPSGQGGGKGESGEKKGDANDGGDAKGEEPSGENGENGESDKTVSNGQETTGDNSTADGGTTGDAKTETVRETSVVDTTAPAAGTAPAATTPVADAAATGTAVPDVTVAPLVVMPVDGQTVNLTDQTITSSTGTTTPITSTTVTSAYVQNDMAVAFVSGSSNYLSTFVELDTLLANPADVNSSLPNPSYTDRYAGKDSSSYVKYILNGTTTVGQATTTLSNGIKFGRFDSTSVQKVVVGNTDCCTAGTTSSNTSVYSHWAVGPAVDPVYLPEVLTGTASYTFAGGTTPTVTPNSPITPGTAALNSASLSVNFTQQVVAFNLSLTVGGTPWTASATGVPLEGMYWSSARVGFRATTFARTGWASMTVTGASDGDVVGQLTGKGLDGAILSYVLNGANDQVTGVAAFTGTAKNTAVQYRIAALSTIDTIPAGQTNAGTVVPVVMGGYNNTSTVVMDAAGNMTQFKADKSFTSGGAQTVSKVGTAVGLGSDPVSGISWGRWQGDVSLTDANNNVTTLNRAPFSHWIAGPVMTGPVALPVSGTYNYVKAGGTAPTDSRGGVGTLNSASLSANFTAQTVNLGVNVTTPYAGNLIASGTNIPIEQKSFFGAATANAPNGGNNRGSLTVTCGGGCGATTVSGEVGGVFVGTGGVGAGMVYGFSKGSVMVNGVVAFHR